MSQQNGSATMAKPTANGNKGAHSQTLDHVTSYPLISDLLDFYTRNSLGAKSIDAFNTLYHSIVTPILPYLRTPLSIASPYLTRADELGDHSLSYVDNHFPAVKSTDYASLKDTAYSIVSYPFAVANSGKEYVTKSYEDESKKIDGEGIVHVGKSVVSTELRIAGDAVKVGKYYLGTAQEKGEGLKDNAQKKAQQAKEQAQQKSEQAQQKAQQAKEQAQQKAQQAKEQANGKTQ